MAAALPDIQQGERIHAIRREIQAIKENQDLQLPCHLMSKFLLEAEYPGDAEYEKGAHIKDCLDLSREIDSEGSLESYETALNILKAMVQAYKKLGEPPKPGKERDQWLGKAARVLINTFMTETADGKNGYSWSDSPDISKFLDNPGLWQDWVSPKFEYAGGYGRVYPDFKVGWDAIGDATSSAPPPPGPAVPPPPPTRPLPASPPTVVRPASLPPSPSVLLPT